uniref:hypothetical protein n=1 Tax=Rheinheimera sp. TaxID=1869214 RepID=UPI002FDCADB7
MDGAAGPKDILQDVKCKKTQSLDWAFLALLGALISLAELGIAQPAQRKTVCVAGKLSSLYYSTRSKSPEPKYKKP